MCAHILATARPSASSHDVGDAELDEGNLWETLLDETLQAHLRNAIWIVDYNRQSLDRVVPGVRSTKLKAMLRSCGWNVIEVKYGADLQAAYAKPGGDALRWCIDDMANEAYQSLIRSDAKADPRRRCYAHEYGASIKQCLADVPDARLRRLLANLGGHDLGELIASTYLAAEATAPDRDLRLHHQRLRPAHRRRPGEPRRAAQHRAFSQWRAAIGMTESAQWDAFAGQLARRPLCARRARVAIARPAAPVAGACGRYPARDRRNWHDPDPVDTGGVWPHHAAAGRCARRWTSASSQRPRMFQFRQIWAAGSTRSAHTPATTSTDYEAGRARIAQLEAERTRPAHRVWHRRDESVHRAGPPSGCRTNTPASCCFRLAPCMTRLWRAGWTRSFTACTPAQVYLCGHAVRV